MKKIIILLLAFILTGCYDYRELKDLAITTAVGINYKDGEYELILQVIDTTKKEENNFFTYKEKGKTMQEAFRNIITKTSKRIYGNHIDLVLISEDILNISDVIDFLYRDAEVRVEFYMAIAKDVDKILETKTELVPINSDYILTLLKNEDEIAGTLKRVTFSEFLDMYVNKNKDIILPTIKLSNDKIESGTMVLIDDKVVDYMDIEESKGYKFIIDDIENTIITDKCDSDNYFSMEIIENKTSYEFKDGIFYINIVNEGNINEMHCDIDLTDNKVIDYIEGKTEEYIKNIAYKSIDKAKIYNLDVFNIKDYIYKNYNDYYKNNNVDINNLNIKINSKTTFINKGEGLTTIKDKEN